MAKPKPVITSNGGGAAATISLTEPEQIVTTVTATHGPLNYSVAGPNGSLFSIDNGGVLRFVSPSAQGSYQAVVKVTNNVGYDTQSITVQVAAAQASGTLVSNSAELQSAISSAAPGDTIIMAPGNYSGIGINAANFSSAVTITSSNLSQLAVLSNFSINGSSGLRFSHLEFSTVGSTDPYYGFRVGSCQDIQFDNLKVHGTMDGDPRNDITGFLIRESSNISVSNSEFQQLSAAINHLDCDHLVFTGNNFHDLSADGIAGGGSSWVTISNNVFSNFITEPGVHPDAIQFWTYNTTASAHDLTITNNTYSRGAGNPSQGIFVGNELSIPYQNVTIDGNSITGGLYHGITVGMAQGLSVTNNTVQPYTDQPSWIDLVDCTAVSETGNKSGGYMVNDSQVQTPPGNVLLDPIPPP